MNKRTWHKGPPPHVGWWNASGIRHPEAWRWWDGKNWSFVAYASNSAKWAGKAAQMGHTDTGIEWTDYYPKNARVPRVDPRKLA